MKLILISRRFTTYYAYHIIRIIKNVVSYGISRKPSHGVVCASVMQKKVESKLNALYVSKYVI